MTMSLCLACTMGAQSAEKIVPIKYGNMDNWVIRNIKESSAETRRWFMP